MTLGHPHLLVAGEVDPDRLSCPRRDPEVAFAAVDACQRVLDELDLLDFVLRYPSVPRVGPEERLAVARTQFLEAELTLARPLRAVDQNRALGR
jgi:hypothetical protein